MADRDLESQISAIVSPGSRTGARDVTDRVLSDSSMGPGELPRLVATAKPVGSGALPPTLRARQQALASEADPTLGFVSKPLAYATLFRKMGKRDHVNSIRLIKGGLFRVEEIQGAPPYGTTAWREAPHADRYYVLAVSGRDNRNSRAELLRSSASLGDRIHALRGAITSSDHPHAYARNETTPRHIWAAAVHEIAGVSDREVRQYVPSERLSAAYHAGESALLMASEVRMRVRGGLLADREEGEVEELRRATRQGVLR